MRLVNTRVEKLAALFNGIQKQLSMDQFDDKLEVQKITFLAQEYGINLGYSFEWYIRGPYCKQVSEDAHTILDSNLTTISPSDAGLNEEQIQRFRELLRPHLNDTEWLEIAGSLLYLKNENYADDELDQIIGYLLEDLSYGYKNFDETLVRRVLADMVRLNLITA